MLQRNKERARFASVYASSSGHRAGARFIRVQGPRTALRSRQHFFMKQQEVVTRQRIA
jgi:hypothetical protein